MVLGNFRSKNHSLIVFTPLGTPLGIPQKEDPMIEPKWLQMTILSDSAQTFGSLSQSGFLSHPPWGIKNHGFKSSEVIFVNFGSFWSFRPFLPFPPPPPPPPPPPGTPQKGPHPRIEPKWLQMTILSDSAQTFWSLSQSGFLTPPPDRMSIHWGRWVELSLVCFGKN